jgi:heptosyltransferase-1
MRVPEKILIIRLSSLGDILHALPALASLRSAFPAARIDWLVERKHSFLLKAVSGIDEIIPLDTHALRLSPFRPSSWEGAARVVGRLRARRYDVCIDFQGLLKSAFVGALSGARNRVGFSGEMVRERPAHWFYQLRPRAPGFPLHVVAQNLLLAELVGAPSIQAEHRFHLDSETEGIVHGLLHSAGLDDFAVINPGGGWPTKRWDPSRYGELAERIQTRLALPVVVTTGPGEVGLFEQMSRHCGNHPVRHFQLSFLQLIPLLRRARLVIGGDTGPFHLACALGTPVVGIFGPTNPVRNGPWKEGEVTVLHRLPCSFCGGRLCPTHNECMDISVEEVFAAVVERLKRHS